MGFNSGFKGLNRAVARTGIFLGKKGKAIPLQAWTGPEGSRRLKLPYFKTFVTRRWQACQPYGPDDFSPQEIFLVLISVRG